MTPPHEQLEKLVNPTVDLEQSECKSADTSEEAKTDWRSIYCTSFLSFCTAAQYSLYFASLWPFLNVIDSEITPNFFGFVVAIYSLGQILASPLVGYWSNRIKQISLPLYTNIALMIVGNFVYLSLEVLSSGRRYWLLFGRFITGVGSSNISLLKAYTTTASLPCDRSRSIAFVTGGIAVGMTVGPAFQLLFVPLEYPGIQLAFGYRLNMYTAPALGACGMNLLCALAIRFFFREHYAALIFGNTEAGTPVKVPPYDRTAVGVCYFTRFVQIFVNSNIECLAAPLSMALFAWSRHDVVEYIASSQAAMSGLAFVVYFFFIVFSADRFLSFRLCAIVSLCGLVCFHLLTFSWPFLPHSVVIHHNQSLTDVEELGCDAERFSWCSSMTAPTPLLFYGAYALCLGFCFSSMNISLNVVFSKLLGPRRQGVEQGWLQVSGGIARIIGPIAMSYVFLNYGPRVVWAVVIAVIVLCLGCWIALYKRLVPLQIPDDLASFDRAFDAKEEDEKKSP